MTGDALLAIDNLSVSFETIRGRVTVVSDLSLGVASGEIVGIVGESGSGKSVTSLATIGLLGEQGHLDSGSIRLNGQELSGLDRQAWRRIRGREIGIIFQEPTTSLNPVFPVGFQIAEVLIEHFAMPSAKARTRAVELMERVGIPAAKQRARDYPHQLSGGMKQRIMIAIALACRPKLLIADEPTTALDVTIQAQILELIRDLKSEYGMGVMLITHDMGVIAEMADRVVVMYAGQIVEQSDATSLFASPQHPYTRLLLRSIPSAHSNQSVLPLIEGTTPSPANLPAGCRFGPRCPMATDHCRTHAPQLEDRGPGRIARCFRLDEDRAVLDAALRAAS